MNIAIAIIPLNKEICETHNQDTNVLIWLILQPVNERLIRRAERQIHTSSLDEVKRSRLYSAVMLIN
jgi:hypothetical protein